MTRMCAVSYQVKRSAKEALHERGFLGTSFDLYVQIIGKCTCESGTND